jgi:hypothetical protein
MWLPAFKPYEEDDGELRGREDTKPFEPWVTTPYAEVKIDEHDPNGSRSALTRPRPSKQTIEKFRLASTDPWSETWSDGQGRIAFLSRAWGRRTGSGEGEVWEQGAALQCDRRFLAELLKKLGRNLLILINLQHYREKNRYGESDEGDGQFAYSYAVAVVDSELNVSLLTPSPEEIAAVTNLGRDARYDFRERLQALRRANVQRTNR